MYQIIADDYLQRGVGYPSLKVDDKDAKWHLWFIRELMQHYINDKQVYQQSLINRKR